VTATSAPTSGTGQQDGVVIALVAAAHYSSHAMQIALPALFPILHHEFGASFTELGLVITLFYAVSGLGQALAGVLVDRYGAHRLLVIGLAALSVGIALAGLASSYWVLLPLAVIAGLGNCVFHPADLSILSHRVREDRLGRAYAAHSIAGSLGYATPPVAVVAIATYANWHIALLAVGLAGLAFAGILHASRAVLVYDTRTEAAESTGAPSRPAGYFALIGSPVVLLAFVYFALTAFAGIGIQTFAVAALTAGYDLALHAATLGLTAYLVGSACGVMLGGLLADRTRKHHWVATGGILAASALMLLLANLSGLAVVIVPVMAAAGMANGLTAPSRDVLVRRSVAGAGTGSVFGFVYSGLDLGSATAPLILGALLDRHASHAVFLAVAGAFALAAPTVMQIRHRPRRPAQLPAGE
jgi:MFS family permease